MRSNPPWDAELAMQLFQQAEEDTAARAVLYDYIAERMKILPSARPQDVYEALTLSGPIRRRSLIGEPPKLTLQTVKSRLKNLVSRQFDLTQLAELLKITTPEEWDDSNYNSDYPWQVRQQTLKELLDDGATEEEAEAAADEAEQKAAEDEADESYRQYYDATMHVIEHAAERLHLQFVPIGEGSRPFQFWLEPADNHTWTDAAIAVRETIEGVGYMEWAGYGEFLEGRPPQEVAIDNLHALSAYYQVFEGTTAQRAFERYLR